MGVVGIGLVAVSTLGDGANLQESWKCGFMWCGFVCLQPRISLCIHPYSITCVTVRIFILFGCGLTLFAFPDPIWIQSRRFVRVGGVIINGLNCDGNFGALSGTLCFTLIYGSISHRFISFFSENLDQMLKGRTFLFVNLFDWRRYCRVFKNFPIPATAFVMVSVVDM